MVPASRFHAQWKSGWVCAKCVADKAAQRALFEAGPPPEPAVPALVPCGRLMWLRRGAIVPRPAKPVRDRIVKCNRPAGHEGAHSYADVRTAVVLSRELVV